MKKSILATVLALGLICPSWGAIVSVSPGKGGLLVKEYVTELPRVAVEGARTLAGKAKSAASLPQSYRATSVPAQGKNFNFVGPATAAEVYQTQTKRILIQASRMPFPSYIGRGIGEKIFNQYLKDSWRPSKDRGSNEDFADEFMQPYEEYLGVEQEFNEFAAALVNFKETQPQHFAAGETAFWAKVESLQEQLSNVAQRIQETAQGFDMLPPDLIHKVQYLQRAQYYLTALYDGEFPEQMPEPILSPSVAISNFYLTGTFKGPSETRLTRIPLNVPRNLRIAVVHGDRKIHSLVQSGAEFGQRGWVVDTFFSPEEFLAEENFLLYDVVIGDFSPYQDDYSTLLNTIVTRSRGGTIVLSASDRKPDQSSMYEYDDRGSNRDWINYAVMSMQAGIDGNLMFFMIKEPTGYNMYHKIVDAYKALGGLPEWMPKEDLCWSNVEPVYDTCVFDLFNPRPPLHTDY